MHQLEREVLNRGLKLPEGSYQRRDLVNILAEHSLKSRAYSKNLEMRMSITSPMLCFNHKNLKPNEQRNLETDSNWIAEEKYDGCRCLIVYTLSEGFSFFSRHIEVKDYLPHDLTENILLIKDGKVSHPGDWKGRFSQSFMLDAEILINGNIDTSLYSKSGVETGAELNAVTALLAINSKDAHAIQLNQAQVFFKVFDIIDFQEAEDLRRQPLKVRRVWLEKLMQPLSELLPFELSVWVLENKDKFFQETIEKGAEGIIYKNLNMPYLTTESRPRTTQIKRKRRASDNGKEDIDAFISGYTDGTEDKQWEKLKLIGGLKLSVFMDDGTEHHIATVSGMPLEIRTALTTKDEYGNAILKPEFYNKVVVCRGQDFSAKSHRLSHAAIDWSRGFRRDKLYLDCKFSKEELLSQVL
jgi:ATP-dependent DNA ligase